MTFFGLNGWEPVVLLIIFLVVVGPQRLPELTRSIVGWVRQVRRWVDESRSAVESEMGIAVEDLKKYDPRQYDPRRIIREAWGDTSVDDILPSKESMSIAAGGSAGTAAASSQRARSAPKHRTGDAEPDGPLPTPFDDEAT